LIFILSECHVGTGEVNYNKELVTSKEVNEQFDAFINVFSTLPHNDIVVGECPDVLIQKSINILL